MANRIEKIIVTIIRPQVGLEYLPDSLEALSQDETSAVYLSLDAHARRAILLNERDGIPTPAIVRALVEAETWRRFL